MEALLAYIYQQITASSLMASLDADNVYPVVAPVETAGQFVLYTASRVNRYTKDGLGDYAVSIWVYASNILDAAALSDTLENDLTGGAFYSEGAVAGYSDDYNKGFIKTEYKLKF